VWGAAADIFQNQKMVHVICLVTAALLMFVLQYVESFEIMCVMFFIANFQTQPTWSLLDQVAMEMLDRIGGDYGKQRLYGAVGYGIGGYMAGVITAAVGIAWCFNMVVALSCISLFLLLRHIPSFQRTKPKMEFLQSLAHILQQRDVLSLFVLVLVIGIVAQLIDSFLFLYLFNLSGNNSTLVGVVIAVETTSELPLFFHANRIIERLGTPCCIFMGVAAYAIRLFAYTLVTNPWTILPVEVLHGITFGLVWAAFTNYVYHSAPEGTEGTMIGLLAAVQKGVGGGIGTLIGGWIYQYSGGRTMWAVALLGVLPVALFIAITFSFLAKNHTILKLKNMEDQLIKRRTPSYGAIPHLGSSQHLDTLS
jgi:MFS family permease